MNNSLQTVEFSPAIARWCLYAHINKINGKRYVGITNKKKPTSRWGTNGIGYKGTKHFYSAIQLYGWDNFEHIVLEKNLTRPEAANLEYMLIEAWNLRDQNYGYNYQKGGYTGDLGRHMSEESRAKISGENNVRAKKVVCLNTRKVYVSETEAARDNNINSANEVGAVADNVRQFAGHDKDGNPLIWVRYEDYINMTEEDIQNKLNRIIRRTNEQQMICLNTMEIFNGIAEASRYCGSTTSGIIRCAQSWVGKQTGHVRRHSGNHPETGELLSWIYKDDYDMLPDEEKQNIINIVKNHNRGFMGSRPVYCLNTMELFSSIRNAGEYAQVKSPANISTKCKKNKIAKCGRHPITNDWLYWMFKEDYDKLSDEEKSELINKYKK